MSTIQENPKFNAPYSTGEFDGYIKRAETLRNNKNKYDKIRLKGLLKIVKIRVNSVLKYCLSFAKTKIKNTEKEARLDYKNAKKELLLSYSRRVKFIKKTTNGRDRFGRLVEERHNLSTNIKALKKNFHKVSNRVRKLRYVAYENKYDYLTKFNQGKRSIVGIIKLKFEKCLMNISGYKALENANKVGKRVVNYKGFGLSSTIVVLLILLAVFSKDSFYSWTSFTGVLSNNSVYAILAVGIMLVLLTGGIDISIASTMAVSACITSELAKMAPTINPTLWVLVAIVIGSTCGLINGVLIGKLNIAPMIATLGTMFAYRGLAYVITGGEQIHTGDLPSSFKAISNSTFLGITTATWIFVIVIIIAAIFLALTKPGRRLYAVGTNEQSATITGTNVANVKIMAYTICGALAGLAGIVFAANYANVHSEVGLNFEMTAIAMCVIGGVSNKGGKGRVDCLILGIFLMSLLMTLLARIPSISSFEEAIKGAIIIVAVIINIVNDNITARKEVLEMGRRL